MKTVSERPEQMKDLYLNELLTNLDRRFPKDSVDTFTRLNNVFNPVELKSVSLPDLGTYGGDDLAALAKTLGDRFGFDKDRDSAHFAMYKHFVRVFPDVDLSVFVKQLLTTYKNDYPDFARLMQISQSHNSTVPYHDTSFRTEMCTFLF